MAAEQFSLSQHLYRNSLIAGRDLQKVANVLTQARVEFYRLLKKVNRDPVRGEEFWREEIEYLDGLSDKLKNYYTPALKTLAETKQSKRLDIIRYGIEDTQRLLKGARRRTLQI